MELESLVEERRGGHGLGLGLLLFAAEAHLDVGVQEPVFVRRGEACAERARYEFFTENLP